MTGQLLLGTTRLLVVLTLDKHPEEGGQVEVSEESVGDAQGHAHGAAALQKKVKTDYTAGIEETGGRRCLLA